MPASTPPAPPDVTVLGPVTLRGRAQLGGLSANAVLSLALAPGHTRSVSALIDDVWPGDPPAGARQALQTLISRLRAGPNGAPIETVPGGYRLAPRDGLDLDLAAAWCTEAREDASAERTERLAAAALALWSEPVAGGATNEELARELHLRADELHLAAVQLRAEALLALGRPTEALTAIGHIEGHERVIAIRMRALAALGRHPEALAVFAAHRERLADELGAYPSAELSALNTELLRATTAHDAPDDTGPLRVGLRRPATDLVGREDDLGAIGGLLATHRLVSIVGVGGLGKTRLAIELAQRHDGAVAVVELAGIKADADVERAVSAAIADGALPIPRPGTDGPTSALAQATDTLARQPTLLVLDNCEHLLEGVCDLTATLLGRIASLRVLTTSRRALGIAGEHVYPLASLPSRSDGRGAGPAVRLFWERARAIRPDAALPDEQVAALTERLDGLPLAIELAAARIRSMSVEEISRRLTDRFALLTQGDRTAPARHRTLRAVIDWSWDLLTEPQRQLGRRLSAFAGSFDAEGATALSGRAGLEVLDDLDALVSHSLLKAIDSPAGATRFVMVQTVHEYCAEQARLAGEAQRNERALFAWARALAHDLVDVMVGRHNTMRVSLHDEEDNLLSVMRRALAAHDSATALAVFGAAGMWWTVQGSISELVGFSSDVIALALADGVPPGSEQDAALAGALIAITRGYAAGAPGDADPGDLIAATLRTDAEVSGAIRHLADLVLVFDRPEEVATLAAQAANDDDPAVRALSRILVAGFTENAGRLPEAIDLAREAHDITQAEHLTWLGAVAAQTLAGMYSQVGDPEAALGWIAIASQELAEVGGHVPGLDLIRIEVLGSLRRGDIAAARRALERWEPGAEAQEPESALLLRTAAAEVELAAGDTALAIELYDRALRELSARLQHTEPWWLIATAAQISVRVAAGQGHSPQTLAIVHALREAVAAASAASTQADYPVIGTLAVAFSAWYAATEPDSQAGPLLLALAELLQSRQDIPSMERERHAAAIDPVGLERARAAAQAIPAADRVAATLALIADPASC